MSMILKLIGLTAIAGSLSLITINIYLNFDMHPERDSSPNLRLNAEKYEESQRPTKTYVTENPSTTQPPNEVAKPRPKIPKPYVCMSCRLGDTLVSQCSNRKCVNYGNPPDFYKQSVKRYYKRKEAEMTQ